MLHKSLDIFWQMKDYAFNLTLMLDLRVCAV